MIFSDENTIQKAEVENRRLGQLNVQNGGCLFIYWELVRSGDM
jgi:hypothetical protein